MRRIRTEPSKIFRCPHCGSEGQMTNKYIYRCDENVECGRYFIRRGE